MAAPIPRRDGPGRRAGPASRTGAGGRTGPSQRAGQPPRAALAGCDGTAGRRHRRLDHGQHPAPGKPQRRGDAPHRRACKRDRAGRRARPPA
ncbi:hypothetical protein G6F40_016728 [Rhizopus arrhizus]|nr:hypothetical protein G6F40_016728 [Rhizopus arrhizus]